MVHGDPVYKAICNSWGGGSEEEGDDCGGSEDFCGDGGCDGGGDCCG